MTNNVLQTLQAQQDAHVIAQQQLHAQLQARAQNQGQAEGQRQNRKTAAAVTGQVQTYTYVGSSQWTVPDLAGQKRKR